ncbi:unnamed protein product [Menidia menidia]|uniref:(Atlantic silverside) hypothetical protein n=1 Tax=Menidia menidia TaxID=238744 RepID=A0A8S4B8J2_9TELE|nr:unnamed protein product [Menidia menidia]
METFVLRLLIITSACALSEKHVFVRKPRIWSAARGYCRIHYTDISPITNEVEEGVLKQFAGKYMSGWIGLYWDKDVKKWKWSGGDNVTNQNWLNGIPHRDTNAKWTSDGWRAVNGLTEQNFFCLNLIVVQEKKTWEEALVHCREHHSSLTSLLSKSETLLAQNRIRNATVTEEIWIGLRYLGDSWLWVNGDPLVYSAWPEGGDQDHLCPVWRRCGALTKEGVWENIGCHEKLHFICA